MGYFRDQRSITVLPGVRVNISKPGLSSVSFGGPGATSPRRAWGCPLTIWRAK